MTADESAALLARELLERRPFVFTKFGDAEIRWMLQFGDQRAEGGDGTPEKGAKLLAAWRAFGERERVFMGDWQTASFLPGDETRYEAEWSHLVQQLMIEPTWLHYESLLAMRLTPELRDFYRVVATDPRAKVLVAPERLAGAANLLRAEHLPVSLRLDGCVSGEAGIVTLLRHTPWDVALFCAGRSAKIAIAELAHEFPDRTLIDLGSALDPLFGFSTRSMQVSTRDAWEYFADLW